MLGGTMQAVQPATKTRLDSLTGLRFYAALLVVITHVAKNFWGDDAGVLLSVGSVGVSFFFVLSGFVLMWSRNPGRTRRDFYRNRFARVYPLHALMLAVAIVLAVMTGSDFSWPALLACVVLMQAWVPFEQFYFALNGPAWSLSCEAFFYATFPALAKRIATLDLRRMAWAGAWLYAGVGVLTLAAHVLLQDGPTVGILYVNPAYRVWEFILGIGLGAAMKQGWRMPWKLATAAAVAGVAYAAITALNIAVVKDLGPFDRVPMQALPADLASLVLTPCFVVLIAAAATADLSGVRSHLRSRPLVALGEWSFALYLSHLLLIGFVRMLMPGDLPALAGVALGGAVIVAAIAVSAFLYKSVERPLEAKLRSPRRANL